MILATLFGALLLTNLLIALMATKYEDVEEVAKQEVIFNQASLTQNLSDQSRFMPPPLGIIVMILAFIVHIGNFFTAFINPQNWNIYALMGHELLERIEEFHIYRCWKCKSNKEIKGIKKNVGHMS